MITNREPLFLESVSPNVREMLVAERLLAMRGRLQEVLTRLEGVIESTPAEMFADRVALGLLWSELLYLDDRDEEALVIFKRA